MMDGLVKKVYTLFAGGTTGKVWKKLSNSPYHMGWGDVDGTIPSGGTTGQVLAKVDASDYNAGWVDASGGGGASYLVYTALLTESGADAPVATIVENTLGGEIIWSYASTGSYIGTLTGAFTENKTVFPTHGKFIDGDGVTYLVISFVYRHNSDEINFQCYDLITSDTVNNVLNSFLIEIRVYP